MPSYTLPKRRTIYPSKSLEACPIPGFSLPVTYISIVGTENTDGKLFHFRLSFVSRKASGLEESIRLDMQPSYTDTNCPMAGVALVEYRPYGYSFNHGPTPFNVYVPPGTTADMLLKIIFDEYKDQYIFTDDGQGCLYWCASILSVLAQHRIIDSSVPQAFAAYAIEEHRRFGPKIPMRVLRVDSILNHLHSHLSKPK